MAYCYFSFTKDLPITFVLNFSYSYSGYRASSGTYCPTPKFSFSSLTLANMQIYAPSLSSLAAQIESGMFVLVTVSARGTRQFAIQFKKCEDTFQEVNFPFKSVHH
uniref:Uncharacterized protein n=1 Tax=Cucumis melo TaxID=3656 RepID=A0A9I9E6N2_CUCME